MADRPLIVGFVKMRNEIIRSGNAYRAITNLGQVCDMIVACDDASVDWTLEVLRQYVPEDQLVVVPSSVHDFRKELYHKQQMLEVVHRLQPHWVFWADADEVLDRAGTAGLRQFALEKLNAPEIAWAFHFTQMWRVTSWARTNAGFDAGAFVKLWKWRPDLSFDVKEGTHHTQFPQQIAQAMRSNPACVGRAPFEVLHYGNVGSNLRFKAIQYFGGLGGVDRHLRFAGAQYRPVAPEQLPDGAEWIAGDRPQPFTDDEIAKIERLRDLKHLDQTFCVVIPTYNRVGTLGRALQSVLDQTYERWVCFVLDDGSTDETPDVMREWQDADPRIFYARYPENRGGVAVNEIGMAIACEVASWWTRLGSDDWWEPRKLEADARALADRAAVYGPYQVVRHGSRAETCNPPRTPAECRAMLHGGTFVASWANCAVRTEVLRAVRDKHGRFCDPRLRNCEDFLINARVARIADWTWRGWVGSHLVISPPPYGGVLGDNTMRGGFDGLEPDAVWTVAEDGASARGAQLAADEALTRQIIAAENT